MAEYRKSILVDEETIAAATDYTYDLPVDPISHLLITLNCKNSGTNVKATLANLLAAFSKISIIFRGAHIYDLSGADLFAVSTIITGKELHQENVIDTDAGIRSITLLLPFGRKLYSPDECFVATKRGELQLKITTPSAFTNITATKLLVEGIELPGAAPKNYLKVYTLTKTVTVTGDFDVELPRGNLLLGSLLFSSVIPTGTTDTCVADKVQLLLNNVRKYYTEARWESLKGELMELLPPANAWAEKIHRENLAATYTQNALTAAEQQVDSDISKYAFLNFGFGPVAGYEIDTAPLAEIKIRLTATATGSVRVLPVELVKVA